MASRPRRRQRADRLTSPDASNRDAVRCDFVIAPFDEMARAMDRKWGIDRLPGLVSTVTADKYGSAIAKLNAALDAADPDECRARAEVCMRGLVAMDAEAVAAGAAEASPECWTDEIDGQKIVVIRDMRFWPKAEEMFPGHHIYSMREVHLGIQKLRNQLVDAVKAEFPGAEIRKQTNHATPAIEHDDEIPF